MNFDWLTPLDPVYQAFIMGIFTWLMTALGAASVFLRKQPSHAFLDAMLGFAAGVMIAASIWSLLLPAIEIAESQGMAPWIPTAFGFLLGAGLLRLAHQLLPLLQASRPIVDVNGSQSSKDRSTLLVLAITLHNLPEGLAIGVAFGAAAINPAAANGATFAAAVTLGIGIGLQNLPEGIAVSVPLRREGISRLKSFGVGQLSAIIEPIAAVIGAAAVIAIQPLLPYALSFAAGAMLFVVVQELIPEAQKSGSRDIATVGIMLGFVVMMVLEIATG